MPQPFCHAEADLSSTLCPMMIGSAMSANGGSNSCIGRRCMAWRFVDTHVANEDGELIPSGDTHGFCGMAGAPKSVTRRDDNLPW